MVCAWVKERSHEEIRMNSFLFLQFLVDRVVPVGNGYLLLNLPNAITNQRRNSIQMTPTRTKLAKPKTAFTMVILAAFYILLTHICSDYYLLPSCQSRRSNAFSPCQEPPLAGRQKSEFLNAGCWHTTHIISTTFTIDHLRNRHRNHVRFKPTMPTGLVTSSFPLFSPRPGMYFLWVSPGQQRKATTSASILTSSSILKHFLLLVLAPSAPGSPQQRLRPRRIGRPRRKPSGRKQRGENWWRLLAGPTKKIKNKKNLSRP